MLTYSFEHIGSDSLYHYLYKCIKKDILSKKIGPGEKLPSKRNLAKNLSVSVITVENAYQQLLAEGYIYSVEKKGLYVCDIEKLYSKPAAKKETKYEVKQENIEYFVDLKSNKINGSKFPFSIWSRLMHDVLSDKGEALINRAPSAGIEELREAIADHLYHFRGMNVSKEQIIIGAGTEYFYNLIIQLLGRDKIYAVEDPGYKKISEIYESNEVRCEKISLDDSGICVDELEKSKSDIMHISPSHHFPTGIIMSIARRYELLSWASKSDTRYIIEDDYDCEFRLAGKPIPTLQSIDAIEKVIYINTFSKSLAPSFRISYMVLPLHLMEKFYENLGFYSCTVSNFEQYTLAQFIKKGYLDKHINRMRNIYRSKRDMLIDCIRQSSLNNISNILSAQSGLHFLLELDTDRSDEEIIKSLRDSGILISSLSEYYFSKNKIKEHTLVINYAGLPEEKIEETVNILARCIISL